MTSSDECRNKPFIEFVHSLQVHVVGLPHILIHQIKSSMSNELVQMSVIILLEHKNHQHQVSTVTVISFITEHHYYYYAHL